MLDKCPLCQCAASYINNEIGDIQFGCCSIEFFYTGMKVPCYFRWLQNYQILFYPADRRSKFTIFNKDGLLIEAEILDIDIKEALNPNSETWKMVRVFQ